MYAIIRTGGKQYTVNVGDEIRVERLDAEQGAEVELTDVLLVGGDGEAKVGHPVVDGAQGCRGCNFARPGPQDRRVQVQAPQEVPPH